MRIRKNAARNSAASVSLQNSSITPSFTVPIRETQVCELNRSPWDVMTLLPQSNSSFPNHIKVETEDNMTDNSGGGESATSSKSNASHKRKWEEELKKEDVEEEEADDKIGRNTRDRKKKKTVDKEYKLCIKSDGKRWNCKREAKEGHSLCEHHLSLLKLYQSRHQKSDVLKAPKKYRKKRGSSNSPAGFYYYSGFGPLWGTKRAIGREEEKVEDGHDDDDVVQASSSAQTSSSEGVARGYAHDDDGKENKGVILHYDDEDDDEDCYFENGSKKRTRKPIKERSLKSLL